MANKEQLKILKQGTTEEWNAWRKNNPSINIDLRGAHLSGADLKGTRLRDVRIVRQDLLDIHFQEAYARKIGLNGADLTKANLSEADLRDVDLREAILIGADLIESNLTGADLTGANLRGSNLTGANLAGTNLKNVKISRTIFGDNDLSSSLGLEKIEHRGPSTIGTETIRKSQGKIPIEFLRGCGLSDLDIEYAKLATPGLDSDQVTKIVYEIHHLYCDQPIQFYSCFISYNNKDQNFAQRLHDDLQKNGVRCWFAPEDMKIGDEFRRAISQEIRLRDKLLIILSQNSIPSEWVGDEVEKALAEEKEQGTLKLFPIRLDSAVFEAKDDWAEKIRLRRHIGDFSGNYAKAFQLLLRDLKQ